MECTVCLMAYGQQLRPLSLPCGHTFCKLCITKVYRERGVVMCPKCQAQHRRTTIENLPINYELEDLMESLSMRGATGVSSHVAPLSGNQEMCSKCSKYMSSWCENCLVFVCNGCTARQHHNKGHKTVMAKEAVEKLRAECIEKLDAKDVLLTKNITSCKELMASSSAMVQKINRAVTQMEQYKNEILAQKVGIQSGASLAAVAKSVSEVINQNPSPQIFQELREAQGACHVVEGAMRTFKRLSTEEQPRSEHAVDGPAVPTPPVPPEVPAPPSPAEVSSPPVIIIPSVFVVDSVIASCQDSLPRMIKGLPRGTEINITVGQPLPFWTFFKLKSTSPNCWFNIYFRDAQTLSNFLEIKVRLNTRAVTMETRDYRETTVLKTRHDCHLPMSQSFDEEFSLRVKEMDEKYVLKVGDVFVGYCKKPKRTSKKSLCSQVGIEGKHTRLLEFRLLSSKE
ncbi:tripartite motif-containing protein 5-like [Oratosquilla oratoria]|uniref:tripartite motif-containing protein 5-like n=1 Tax=Oratosquilla oratoria TaxID=337810 RepID=UPI003F7595AD